MSESPLVPDTTGIPEDWDAEPEDADVTHEAGVDLDDDEVS